VHTALLRELFGNVFDPVVVEPAWLTSTVRALAHQIHHRGEFDLLPVLGDALQDAGCDDEQVLDHCHRPGDHVRGCFVIDALLGRG